MFLIEFKFWSQRKEVMMPVKEYFKSIKTTIYQSVLTRRMLYNFLSLLVMLTYFASNAEGSFSSEVFRLAAEGNCRYMHFKISFIITAFKTAIPMATK